MADWILKHRYQCTILFLSYFAAHIVMRISHGGCLSYDETEQVFLSQWIQWGYNSQPPLYTWIQSILFSVFGYHVFALSLFKNTLIASTYIVVYGLVFRTTQDPRHAIAGSLGMLMIPQIAWESHRDLSHTVLVTFATALLVYCVVSTMKQRTTRWYVAIGVASALGMMSKYNFAIVVVAIVASSMTIPRYRHCLLDKRLLITIMVAVTLVTPHMVWVLNHPQLASAKTIDTLTTEQTNSYWHNLIVGSKALVGSIFSCVVLAFAVFGIAYRDRFLQEPNCDSAAMEDDDVSATVQMMERFFLAVLAMLLVVVLSGNGLEFKNRWIQPFVCLLPAYLVLRWRVVDRSRPHFDEGLSLNRITLMGAIAMLAVMTAVVVRQTRRAPRSSSLSNHAMSELVFLDDHVVLAADARVAGELKLISPERLVLAREHEHLGREQWPKHDWSELSNNRKPAVRMSRRNDGPSVGR